jgi:hypothetical protein
VHHADQRIDAAQVDLAAAFRTVATAVALPDGLSSRARMADQLFSGDPAGLQKCSSRLRSSRMEAQ